MLVILVKHDITIYKAKTKIFYCLPLYCSLKDLLAIDLHCIGYLLLHSNCVCVLAHFDPLSFFY